VREILTGANDFDTAVFSAPFNDPITGSPNYNIFINDNGTALDFSDDIVTVIDNVDGRDGTDTLKGIERLQFNDLSITLVPGLNADPVNLLTVNDDSPSVGQLLTVSAADIVDADNVSLANPTGVITDGPIGYTWQVERDPVAAPGVFEDIVALGGGNPATAAGNAFRVTPDLLGLSLRVKAIYQDANGVLETVFSAPTAAVGAGAFPTPAAPPAETPVASPGGGLHLIRPTCNSFSTRSRSRNRAPTAMSSTLSRTHACRSACGRWTDRSTTWFRVRRISAPRTRTSCCSSIRSSVTITTAIHSTRMARRQADWSPIQTTPIPATLPMPIRASSPILISDQTATNLSAAIANGDAEAVLSPGLDGIFGTEDDREVFFIPNATPDAACRRVQRLVRVLRPVLRPRPRPGR
jgi:hypothetical protein